LDRFEAMTVFVATVDCGSLSAAGRKLEMPLPTVSRKLAELEARIGTTLLRRSTRRLELTDAGHAYHAACKRILEETLEAERGASGEYSAPRGELHLTAPVAFGRTHLVPVVAEFLGAYPDVDVRLTLSDRSVNLLEEHVDLALRIGELADSGLIARRVGDIRKLVCAAPSYLDEHGRPRQPEDLRGHAAIAFEALGSRERWVFDRARVKQTIAIRARLAVNNADAAIAAAIAGAGITRVLSYQANDALRAGLLERLLEEFEPAPLPVHLLYAGGSRLPLKLRAFIDFALPRLQARIAPLPSRAAKPQRSSRKAGVAGHGPR
jgi:DNA-binding transcriptional LysR family regulator